MRFPLRLSADLALARFLSRISRSPYGPILRLSPLLTPFSLKERFEESSTDLEWDSPEECLRRANQFGARIVWLGGAEPLLHPEIGRVAGALTESGRHVFLHTSGRGLRRRIHEFQPGSRLFLVLEFAGREAVHDSRAGQPGAYRRVLESFRAAKLSGFLVCAHITIGPDSDACEIGELFEELCAKDADGLIVSSGGTNSAASTSGNLGEIRGLIRHGGWERFSRILESSPVAPAAVPARPRISGKQEGAFEEGV
jgi:hypothetical protein